MRFTPCAYAFFQFLPPAPCPSRTVVPYFPIPHAPTLFHFLLRFPDLRLTVFDHYFDLLGIFCYDAVTSGFPL